MSPPNPATIDPAVLVAFRQEAKAIIAAQRGLTPASLAKVVGIAQRLGIADEQFDEALRSLAIAEPSAPPNPQVEKFRRRLRKDLSVNPSAVIGPTIEAQILANAKRKYGLSDALVGEVLAEVASELGLTRITSTDAIRSLAAQIDQAAGNNTWLASEARNRLHAAGEKWAIPRDVVNELIDERLKANRNEYSNRERWTKRTIFGAVGAAALTAIVLGGLILWQPSHNEDSAAESSTANVAATRPRAPTTSDWWTTDLSIEMAHLRTQLPDLTGAIDLASSSKADERAIGYEQLLDHLRTAPDRDDLHAAATRIFVDCYLHDPDDATANRLRSALVHLLPAIDAQLPPNWNSAFWSADACAEALSTRTGSRIRKTALADALSSTLGDPIDISLARPALNRRLQQLIIRAAYRQLTAAAVKQPAEVALLYTALAPQAASLLSDEEFVLAETTFLVVALPAAGSDWRVYERSAARCIASPESLPTLRLLEAYRRVTDPKLVEHLTELLTVRAGVRPKSPQKSAVIAAVRQALAAGSTVTAYERWQSLLDEAAPLLEKKPGTDVPKLLGDTILLAHYSTLAISLTRGEPGFALFDAGLENPPQISPDKPGLGHSSSLPRPIGRALTKAQQRDVSRAVETLGKTGFSARADRESALKDVAEIAGETADIITERAEPIATYLLSEKSLEEHTRVLTVAAQLRRWKHLRLALADGLAKASLPLDRQRELIAAISSRDVTSSTTDDMRRVLLSGVLTELESSAAGSASASTDGDSLDKAQEIMTETFRQRAALLNASPMAVSAARDPAAAIQQSLAALAAGKPIARLAARLPLEMRAVRYLASTNLHEVVGLERMFAELSAAHIAATRPQQAGAARRIASEHKNASDQSTSIVLQLRNQEATILKLWLLYAPEL